MSHLTDGHVLLLIHIGLPIEFDDFFDCDGGYRFLDVVLDGFAEAVLVLLVDVTVQRVDGFVDCVGGVAFDEVVGVAVF